MKNHFRYLLLILILLCTAIASATGLDVYFLDVGQGNSAVIVSDDHVMMIDGGPASASQYVHSFLEKHGIQRIDYMVATHMDADHVGGLPAALQYVPVGIVFSIEETPAYDSLSKYLDEQKIRITVPNVGDRFTLGDASVTILGPRKGTTYSGNTSLVLRVDYKNTSFLFVGDSEIEDENALIDSKVDLKSTVLAVGHHGSASSTSERFLKKASPEYAIISVGADNTYGHPKQSVLDRLKKFGVTTYRTDQNGMILCSSDGQTVTIQTEKNATQSTGTTPAPIIDILDNQAGATGSTEKISPTYVGNKNSKVFHYPDCSSVAKMKDKNKEFFYGDREEPIADGYKPCGKCDP